MPFIIGLAFIIPTLEFSLNTRIRSLIFLDAKINMLPTFVCHVVLDGHMSHGIFKYCKHLKITGLEPYQIRNILNRYRLVDLIRWGKDLFKKTWKIIKLSKILTPPCLIFSDSQARLTIKHTDTRLMLYIISYIEKILL